CGPATTQPYTLSLHDALPIFLVDEAGTIIAGHGRVLAAARLGLDQVPVMVARGWTEAQKRAYPPRNSASGQNLPRAIAASRNCRSEEHTSELQSRSDLVCRLL